MLVGAKATAKRVVLELSRDRRTIAFFVVVPIIIMTLVYYAVGTEEESRIAVVARGEARLFVGELEEALAEEDDVTLVTLQSLPDSELDPKKITSSIERALRQGEVDAVVYIPETLLADRFADKPGQLHIYVEGARPTMTSTSLSAVSGAMDDLAAALPVVIAPDCSAHCADSVNNSPMDLEEHYVFGSDDLRFVDFFLPVFPPFFVFFFTFILATITFQRERVRGTLERLMIAPTSFVQVVAGYVMGFLGFAMVQAGIVVAYCLKLLQTDWGTSEVVALSVVTLLLVFVALFLGLCASFFARTEFQAVQFIPLVILPQLFLADLIWDIRTFPPVFRGLSMAMPLTYANAAMRQVLLRGESLMDTWPNLLALCGFVVLMVVLMTVVVSRRFRRI